MKKLLSIFLILALLWPVTVYPTIAVPQGISATVVGAGVSSVTTGNLTTTNGSAFVAASCHYSLGAPPDTFSNFTDSKSNTYTDVFGGIVSGSDDHIYHRVGYDASATGGATHNWTLTLSGNGFVTIAAIEVTDAKPVEFVDKFATKGDNSGTTNLTSTATATTTQAQALAVGVGCSCTADGAALSSSSGNGYTQVATIDNLGGEHCGIVIAYRVLTAIGAQTFTWDIDESIVGGIGSVIVIRENIGAPPRRPAIGF